MVYETNIKKKVQLKGLKKILVPVEIESPKKRVARVTIRMDQILKAII
jgi:hypothetical protein